MKKNNFKALIKIVLLLIFGVTMLAGHVHANENKTSSSVASADLQNIDEWMPDKNLQLVVAQSLNKTIPELTKYDMTKLSIVNFDSLPKDTNVDFTGLELATNLRELYTTNIIATNIPAIHIAQNGTLYTRPNVLKYITPLGLLSNVHIGNFDAFLPMSELIGIGENLTNWEFSNLTIYTTGIFDFSQLHIPSSMLENGRVSIISNTPLAINPIVIKDNISKILYSDQKVKDTTGNLLLSSLSNVATQFSLAAVSKSGNFTYLTNEDDYVFTPEGLSFNNIPADTDYILIRGRMLGLTASSSNTLMNYMLSFKIPVKYLYTAKDVTVKFVDNKNIKIPGSKDVILHGYIGDPYTTEQKTIDGYTFKEIQGSATGTFTDRAQTVTYVYTKNPIAGGRVTAKYVDTEGNQISSDIMKTGNIGDLYTTEQKVIDGYTLKETQGRTTGTFTDQAQTVTYVYSKNDVIPKPDKHSEIPQSKTENNKIDSSPKNKHLLPQTGENEVLSIIGLIFGVLVIFGAAAMTVIKRKKQD